MDFRKKLGCSSLALTALLGVAQAQATEVFTGPFGGSGDAQGPFQIGDDFTVTSPNGITITQLGIFDDGFDGLTESHNVALYSTTAMATPLATVTVPAGTTGFAASDGPYTYTAPGNSTSSHPLTQGGFRYMNLTTPLYLPDGFTGSIVGYDLSDTSGNVDDYGDFGAVSSGASGAITSTVSRFTATSANTGFPTANTNVNEVFGTASFTFTTGLAPEPASLALLALGAGGLLCRRRRA